MKTLHLYLLRQVLQTLGMTVIVCTFVLLVAGDGLRLVLPLLVSGQATIGTVLHALALLIPYVLVFSLPMGLLTAMLLVFGRFSADQEYTAVRAGGISLVALITPVLVLSAGFCGLSALITMEIGPQCRTEFKRLLNQIYTTPTAFITEGRFITECEGYVIYVGKRKGDQLENILVNRIENNRIEQSVRAAGGTVIEDRENQKIILRLTNAQSIFRPPTQADEPAPGTNALAGTNAANSARPTTNLMSGVKPLTNSPPAMGTNAFGTNAPATPRDDRDLLQMYAQEFPLTIDLNKVRGITDKPKINEMTMMQLLIEKAELKRLKMDKSAISVVDVQIHRQISFSFACLGFTLVGIPLGIRAHRRETSAGIGIGIGLVLVYYSFIIIGQSLDARPGRYPHLIVWIPTFLFQIMGGFMIWRANRKVT